MPKKEEHREGHIPIFINRFINVSLSSFMSSFLRQMSILFVSKLEHSITLRETPFPRAVLYVGYFFNQTRKHEETVAACLYHIALGSEKTNNLMCSRAMAWSLAKTARSDDAVVQVQLVLSKMRTILLFCGQRDLAELRMKRSVCFLGKTSYYGKETNEK